MTRLITDTTACLSESTLLRYNIPSLPQIVSFGEDSYREGIDISVETFMEKLKASRELPKTSAPTPEWFKSVFEKIAPSGEPIICIHPSADVSGTVRSASVAAMDFPGADIRVVDTRTIASALGTIVVRAAELNETGCSPDEIVKNIQEMAKHAQIFFMVNSLDHLAKGGRIGGASALLGSMLQIKPILTFEDGRVNQFDRERTQKQAVNRLKQLVYERYPSDQPGFLTVLYAGLLADANQVAEEVKNKLNLPSVPVVHMPPAIVTHAGPELLGVSFFTSH